MSASFRYEETYSSIYRTFQKRSVSLLSCFYEIYDKAGNYCNNDKGYEVHCNFVQGYIPVRFRVRLNGNDVVEGCVPDVCGFYIE